MGLIIQLIKIWLDFSVLVRRKMKKQIYCLSLIVGIVAIESCSMTDENSSASSTLCTTQQSGSITIGSNTVSGKYALYVNNTSTPECVDNSSSQYSGIYNEGMFGNTGNTGSLTQEIVITS